MFALFKWLLWFCLPSTLVLVGMLAVACWLFWRKQYRPAVVLFCLDALLTFVMLPWTSMTRSSNAVAFHTLIAAVLLAWTILPFLMVGLPFTLIPP